MDRILEQNDTLFKLYRILEQNDTLFKLFEYSAARWHGCPMASYIDGTQAYTYGSFQEKVLKMSVLLAPITRTPPARQRQSGRTDGSIPETLRQWTPRVGSRVGSTSAEGSTTSSWVLPERTFTPRK